MEPYKELVIGNIYNSNNYGMFEIIDGWRNDKGNLNIFKIKFLDTGYETIISRSCIYRGEVRDRLKPVIAGVGYLGYFNKKVTDPDVRLYYKIWSSMLKRCYDMTDNQYKSYGAAGVTVDASWFCFNIFYNDIHYLPNFHLKEMYPSEYQLDKDYLQQQLPKSQRVYSKNTCIWLSRYDNVLLSNIENHIRFHNDTYIGVFKTSSNRYLVKYGSIKYGLYDDPIAAANAYNFIYNTKNSHNPFANIPYIPNSNVPYMTLDNISVHTTNLKTMCKLIN